MNSDNPFAQALSNAKTSPNTKTSVQHFPSHNGVGEYKRTCNNCGKVWHSLVERENKIDPNRNVCCDQDTLGECGTCGTNSAQAQYRRNIQSREDTLSQLRRCPECHSVNYKEEIIYH